MESATLAYIGDDGALTLRRVDDDGPGDAIAVAPRAEGARMVGPTWSAAGELVVSRTSRDNEQSPAGELHLHSAQQPEGRMFFRNPPRSPNLMAPGVAHYATWSHNGRRLALVAPGTAQLQLHLLEPSLADPELPPKPVLDGAPMFLAWSPDDRSLAVHRGSDLLLIDAAALEAGADADEAHQTLISDVPTYRAPCWTVDGESVIYAAPRANAGNSVWTVRRDGSDRGAAADLDGVTSLSRAPNRDLLALLTLGPEAPSGHDLRLLDLKAKTLEQIEAGPVAAVLWAPDGSALYYFVPSSGDGEFAVGRRAVDGGATRWLTHFRPSAHFMTLLTFYDQYAHSHQLLSPDGRWLTLGGVVQNNGSAGRLGFATQPGCYVMPTDGSAPPQRVGAAEIGFFGPASGLIV